MALALVKDAVGRGGEPNWLVGKAATCLISCLLSAGVYSASEQDSAQGTYSE